MFGKETNALCQRCKEPIIARAHNAKYCKGCVHAANRDRNRERHRARRVEQQQPVQRDTSLAQIAAMAREAGMTYGAFVGRAVD